jgi:hypothetical protein
MIAFGFGIEMVVEGSDPIDSAGRNFEPDGNVLEGVYVKIAKDILCCMQGFDEGIRLVIVALHGQVDHFPAFAFRQVVLLSGGHAVTPLLKKDL